MCVQTRGLRGFHQREKRRAANDLQAGPVREHAQAPTLRSVMADCTASVSPFINAAAITSAGPDTDHGPSHSRNVRQHRLAGNDEAEPQAGQAEKFAEGAEDDEVVVLGARMAATLRSGCMSPKASSTSKHAAMRLHPSRQGNDFVRPDRRVPSDCSD